jgi:hypothetical protein
VVSGIATFRCHHAQSVDVQGVTVLALVQFGWNAPSLSEWWMHLELRHAQLTPWVQNQVPKAVWLAGLFRPATFLQVTCQVCFGCASFGLLLCLHTKQYADLGHKVGQVARA